MLRVLICSFFLLVVSSSAQPLSLFCANSTNSSSPTNRTIQDSQRQRLLTNLAGAASSFPFFFVAGNSSNETVAGPFFFLAQCRPDISSTDCSTCLFAGIELLTTAAPFYTGCPFSPAASVRFDYCLLRYSDSPLLGASSGDEDSLFMGSLGSATDPMAFKERVWQLLQGLAADAAQSPSRFAAGESGGVYGMAWCTLDLPGDFCLDCLTSKIDGILLEKAGWQSFDFSCLLRFESYKFFNAAVQSAEAPALVEVPAPVVPNGLILAIGSLPPITVGDNNGNHTTAFNKGNSKRSGRAVRVICISLAAALALILISC